MCVSLGAVRLTGSFLGALAGAFGEDLCVGDPAGLADWLTTVRRHHEGTYQHCLLVTGVAVLAGSFYAAGQHEIGSLGITMCRYGRTFCDNPVYVLVAAGLAAIWGALVSVR